MVLNLGKVQCPLALQLVCDIVFAVFSMIVCPVLAWVLFVHKLGDRPELYVVARRVERDEGEAVLLLVSHCPVLHALVLPISKNLNSLKHFIKKLKIYTSC